MAWSEWKNFGGDFEIIDTQCKVSSGDTQTINISYTSNGEKLVFIETSYGDSSIIPKLNGNNLTPTSQKSVTSVQYSVSHLKVYEVETNNGDVFTYNNSITASSGSAGARKMVSTTLFKC